MSLDDALRIVNDPSLNAYCDYTHAHLYRTVGEFEFGYDELYDEIAYAFAYAAVEMALDDELLEYIPDSPPAEKRESESD